MRYLSGPLLHDNYGTSRRDMFPRAQYNSADDKSHRQTDGKSRTIIAPIARLGVVVTRVTYKRVWNRRDE